MVTEKKLKEKKEIESNKNWSWEMLMKFFWQRAEEKIKNSADEAKFFLRKKIIAGVLFFWGMGLFLVGIVLVFEKVLFSLGFSGAGGGWLLLGAVCLILSSVISNLKR